MVKVVKSCYAPKDINHLWIDLNDNNRIKMWTSNGGWSPLSVTEEDLIKIQNRIDELVGKNASEAIDTFKEIEEFLSGITNKESLTGLLNMLRSDLEDQIQTKVDKVSGKQLTTNDFTNPLKSKLDSLPTSDSLSQTLNSKADRTYVDNALDGKFDIEVANDILKNKVDKVIGKQLSTEDFTSQLKSKLESLGNYDDRELSSEIENLKQRLDVLVGSEDATSVIDTFMEIENFLQGITNTETLTGLMQDLKKDIVKLIPAQSSYVRRVQADKEGITSINTLYEGGHYRLGTIGNIPELPSSDYNYSQLLVVNGAADTVAQVLFPYQTIVPILVRVGNPLSSTGSWGAWRPIVTGHGTSSQFIKGDGSFDSTQYVTTNNASINKYLRINFDTDTSRMCGISFRNTSGNSISQIMFHNIMNKLFLCPNSSTNIYDDARGKYSLCIGENFLTYNCYPILHQGNYSNYLNNAYLPLSGGTVNGTTQFTSGSNSITVHRTGLLNSVPYIRFSVTDTSTGESKNVGELGYSDRVLKTWDYTRQNWVNIWTENNQGQGSGLNADKVDDYHVSSQPGNILPYTQLPTKATLAQGGWLQDGTTTDIVVYVKALCRWVADNHLNSTIFGYALPSSRSMILMNVYNEKGGGTAAGAEEDLPRYCTGILMTVNGLIASFGTYNGEFFFNYISKSREIQNAASSTYSRELSMTTTTDIAKNIVNQRASLLKCAKASTGLFPAVGDTNIIFDINRGAESSGHNYYSQLGFSSNGQLYYRSFNGTAVNTTLGWTKILTQDNYASILDSRYPKGTTVDNLLSRIDALTERVSALESKV